MASAENPPRLSQLGEKLQKRQGWFENLLRLFNSEQGGDVVSGGNGNGNGASPNGVNEDGDVDSPADTELDTIVASAVRTALERAAAEKAKDPLREDNGDIMPQLLIGAQVSYNTDTWSPDLRSRAPEGSPERLAYEADPITFSHPEVRAAFRLVDEIDAIVDAELGITGDDE